MSLFPFTAPVSMIARLAVGSVPWWQLLLAVGLMLASVLLVVRAVARIFQAQVLLSGQPFNTGRFLAALLAKV